MNMLLMHPANSPLVNGTFMNGRLPLAWAQRAGYLLELVGAQDKVAALKEYVRQTARDKARLLPSVPAAPETKSNAWRLNINTEIEVET